MTLSNESRDRVKGLFEPIALAMGRAGLTPAALTLIGFGITVIGAYLLALQWWFVGGLVVLFGGVFDMFDGTLARATGKVSPFGAFLDSVFDRWGEALVYIGIIIGLIAAGWADIPVYAAAALVGSFMVSYTRARGEGLGFSAGTGLAAVGLMPREVRLVILTLSLIVGGWLPTTHGPDWQVEGQPVGMVIINVALAVIALGATITTIQRILHVRNQARQQASSPQPSETNT
jgi:phosphatidylglycerophosphate synthase